jgi:hypothetical protein
MQHQSNVSVGNCFDQTEKVQFLELETDVQELVAPLRKSSENLAVNEC